MELDDDVLFEGLSEDKKKELNLFKDRLFEFLSGDDFRGIVDIEADDLNDMFTVTMISGRMFEVQCREVVE